MKVLTLVSIASSAVTIKTIGPRRYSAYGGQIDKVTLQIYPKDTTPNRADGE